MILQPAFPHRWLEFHPCTSLPAKAGSVPAGVPALPEVKLAPPSQAWNRQRGCRGLRQTGKVTGHSLCACDQEERPLNGCGSCCVNLAVPRVPRYGLPSCFPGWKMTQVSTELLHPAPVKPGSHPNPTSLLLPSWLHSSMPP